MTDWKSGDNPFAVPGAQKPRVGWYDIDGCRLYAETRGRGPAILIIGAASDDAEMFRPIAERLTGFTVVTYDPRGTLRSGSDGWPCDSARHADDAADLLRALGLAGPAEGAGTPGRRADIFGASAGGIVAVQLALRHPELVRRVLVFEPGYLRLSESGRALASGFAQSLDQHLFSHPDDWAGAMAAGFTGLLDAPEGLGWYAERGNALAENFIRGDIPLTAETVNADALAGSRVDISFACGSDSPSAFRDIADELTRLRRRPGSADPERPDVVDGAGHLVYFTPEPVASYIRRRLT